MSHPGLVVLYRWKLKSGHEAQFEKAWTEVTKALLAKGSLGSRLHHGDDGAWYAYAQWPSAEVRQTAFELLSGVGDAIDRMNDAVAERFPETVLEIAADFLVD
jgi:Antibiotic biosynthesis monooxygenase